MSDTYMAHRLGKNLCSHEQKILIIPLNQKIAERANTS